MKRLFTLVLLLTLLCGGLNPSFALAQGTPDTSDSVEADEETVAAVEAFVDTFVEAMNAQDSSIVNVADESGLGFFGASYDSARENVETGYFAEIVPLEATNVLVYADDSISADITLTGYNYGYEHTLRTERWFMLPREDGSFILHDLAYIPLQVPGDMTTASLTLEVSNEGLELDVTEIKAADVVLIETINLEEDAWASAAINQLPEGMDPLDAQQMIIQDYEAVSYLGKTPVRAGETVMFGFLLDPGATYIIQQYILTPEGQIASVPEGAERYATFTIVE